MNTVKREDFRLKFIGTSAESVTGSAYLIETKNQHILLDCGLYQSGNNIRKNFEINNRPLQIKYTELNYIFISHCNIDHCGLLPRLYKNGCKAQIVVPSGSKKLLEIMLYDTAKILETDARLYNNKNKNKPISPIFTEVDVKRTLEFVTEYNFGITYILNNYLKFKFYHAGHIVRSAQIFLELTSERGITKKFGYTGDIGMPLEKPYITARESLPYCDMLIGECTYGAMSRSRRASPRSDRVTLHNAITDTCIKKNNKLLLGVFSLDRLQNILTTLYDMYHDDPTFSVPIIIDAPLGLSISSIYNELIEKDEDLWKKVKTWGNIVWINTIKASRYYRGLHTPQIILSTSNMLSQGRIIEWVKALLPEKDNYIGFCGFNGIGGLVDQIKKKKQFLQVKIGNEFVKNECNIKFYTSFSSHADRDELISYYLQLNYNKLFLVHCDVEDKKEFFTNIKSELGKQCRTSKVVLPQLEQVFYMK